MAPRLTPARSFDVPATTAGAVGAPAEPEARVGA
jgi:hypothetical protein